MSTTFRKRALAEAARYGSDSWVFLRELLQNARDANAKRVEIEVRSDGRQESIRCRDDGSGMSYRHARRYLFALYASSKEGDTHQVGQFGVGFWSVLRFAPQTVTIRSRTRDEEGWQVVVDGDLGETERSAVELPVGTEILLERPVKASSKKTSHPLEEKVERALQRYGRFVTRKDASARPLEVRLNGRLINEEMTLPAPSATFRGRGFRGVVGLGAEPRVELFANGLFVRRASCLEDLLEDSDRRRRDGRESLTLPGSLAPQVVLDSQKLEVMLARSDVRETRELERLVRAAEKELARLVERQLQSLRPQPWYLPLWGRAREAWGRVPTTWAAIGGLVGFMAAAALAWQGGEMGFVPPLLPSSGIEAYSDLASRYQGPQLDAFGRSQPQVELRYEPPDEVLFWRALQVEDPSRWSSESQPTATQQYVGIRCEEDCVNVTLTAAAQPGLLRLPVPTGHRLDPQSVRLNGEPQRVFATAADEPVISLGALGAGILEYRTGWAPAPLRNLPPVREPPAELREAAAALQGMTAQEKVRLAVDWVQRRVEYDRSDAAVALSRQARDAGNGFLAAALASGKGDCDVQNGVLVALLRLADVEARLAVGWVGISGRLVPGLHAWAEYLEVGRRWRVADASTRFSRGTVAGGDRPAPRAAPIEAAPSSDFPLFVGDDPPPPLGPNQLRTNWPIWQLLGLGSLLLLLILAIRSRRGLGSVHVATDSNLAALLGGALEHAELARLPVLLHGRFVPLLDRGAISLHHAQRLASKGRLYSSTQGSELARKASRQSLVIIDASVPEGQVVSLGVGAVDLDEWAALLERSQPSKLADELNGVLRDLGERWTVATVPALGQRLRQIDLSRIGLGERVVLIDPEDGSFAGLGEHSRDRPATSVLVALDGVIPEIDLPPHRRAHLLAVLADRALAESCREAV